MFRSASHLFVHGRAVLRHRLSPRRVVTVAALAAAYVVTAQLAPNGLPLGVVLLGLLLGALSGLLATGLVLIYRANRFVNFAHGPMGLLAGVATALLVVRNGLSFWVALPIGIALGAVIGVTTERLVIARFSDAPRVIVTVASIGLAQVYGAIAALLPVVYDELNLNYRVPWSASVTVGPVRFDGGYLLLAVMATAALTVLTAFLKYSTYGVAIRALAQNAERARSLGIPAARVSMLVWGVAGALAAVGGVMTIPVLGFSLQGTQQGPSVFLLALAAAVIGRMRSLFITIAASLGLGVLYQAVFWTTARSSYTDLAVLAIILVALAVQRGALGRASDASSATSWQAVELVRPIPAGVLGLPVVRWARRGALTTAVVLAVTLPLVLTPSQTQILGVIIVFALAAVSVAVVSGYAGQISLGHWAIVGVGAFQGVLLFDRLGFLPGLVVAALSASLVAVLIGLPALRITGLFYAVTTLAFAVPAQTVLFSDDRLAMDRPVAHPSLFGIELASDRDVVYVLLAVFALVLVVVANLRRSVWGREILATRENEKVAAAHGVNTLRAKILAFAMSGAIAGIAGYLYLFNQRIVDAQSFAAERSLALLTMVVVGGLGSMLGAVVGAITVESVVLYLDGAYQLLGTGAGLLLVLLFVPGGISSIIFRLRDRLVERVAAQRELRVSGFTGARRQAEALAD